MFRIHWLRGPLTFPITQLVLNMAADIHAQPTTTAIGASVTRISAAIRMAQNLGLHRESVATSNDPEEMAKIELKRRVWAVCVIFDRWSVVYTSSFLSLRLETHSYACFAGSRRAWVCLC